MITDHKFLSEKEVNVSLDPYSFIGNKVKEIGPDKFIIVADTIPWKHHGDHFLQRICTEADIHREHIILYPFSAIETEKTLSRVHSIIDAAIENKLTRRSLVISFGGGLTSNISGLVAALLFRGVPIMHCATTLLNIADGVISLKQAVNGPDGKNKIGTYHKPQLVACDLNWLSTLPSYQLYSGLAEILKNGLVISNESVGLVDGYVENGCIESLENIIKAGINIKLNILKNDPCEKTEGVVFEFGHTIGHAIEYVTKDVSHGHAVCVGLAIADKLSYLMGGLDGFEQKQRCISIFGLLIKLGGWPEFALKDVIESALQDNKRGLIECHIDEIPMVISGKRGKPLYSNRLPLIAVRLDMIKTAIEMAKNDYQAYLSERKLGIYV